MNTISGTTLLSLARNACSRLRDSFAKINPLKTLSEKSTGKPQEIEISDHFIRASEEGPADLKYTGFRETRIYAAVVAENRSELRAALQAGEDLTLRGEDNETYMHVAAQYGSLKMIKDLSEAGARSNVRNKFGQTPSQVAKKSGHEGCSKKFNELVELERREGLGAQTSNHEGAPQATMPHMTSSKKDHPDNGRAQSYSVNIQGTVNKTLANLPDKFRSTIQSKIDALKKNPKPSESKKLYFSVDENLWRIRVGNYWVIYAIDEEKRTVTVNQLGTHDQVYARK